MTTKSKNQNYLFLSLFLQNIRRERKWPSLTPRRRTIINDFKKLEMILPVDHFGGINSPTWINNLLTQFHKFPNDKGINASDIQHWIQVEPTLLFPFQRDDSISISPQPVQATGPPLPSIQVGMRAPPAISVQAFPALPSTSGSQRSAGNHRPRSTILVTNSGAQRSPMLTPTSTTIGPTSAGTGPTATRPTSTATRTTSTVPGPTPTAMMSASSATSSGIQCTPVPASTSQHRGASLLTSQVPSTSSDSAQLSHMWHGVSVQMAALFHRYKKMDQDQAKICKGWYEDSLKYKRIEDLGRNVKAEIDLVESDDEEHDNIDH